MTDMENIPITFKISFWRFFLTQTLVIGGGVSLGAALGMIMSGSFRLDFWLPQAVIAMAVACVLALVSWATWHNVFTIVIADQEVNGPARGTRTTIPIQQVDLALSRKRNIQQYIFGKYEIQSSDGKKIAVNGTFSKSEFNRMLEIIRTMQNSLVESSR